MKNKKNKAGHKFLCRNCWPVLYEANVIFYVNPLKFELSLTEKSAKPQLVDT